MSTKRSAKAVNTKAAAAEFVREITSSKKALIQGGGFVINVNKPVVSTK